MFLLHEFVLCKMKLMHVPNKQFIWKRGMSLAMNDIQFSAFILHLKSNKPDMSILTAACVLGQLPCDSVWVLGLAGLCCSSIVGLCLHKQHTMYPKI